MADTKDDLALPEFDIKKAAAVGTPRSALIFGRSKGGKSVAAASIVAVPGFERTLVVDVEGGAASISSWYPEADVILTPTHKEFTRVIEAILNGKLDYDAVIIDTLDKAQERALEVFDRETPVVNGKKDGFFKWGKLKAWTEKLGDLLHQAKPFVIFVAHDDDHKDDDSGITTTTVLLSGKSRLTFPSIPDLIGHFKIVKVKEEGSDKKVAKRVLDFSVDDRIISGQRYGDALNGAIVDPDFEKIFRKIEPARFKD